jgi:hypothetical protein
MVLDDNANFLVIHRQVPRVAESLRTLWGSAEFDEFVHNLLTDTRDGARRGFPLGVAQALFRLAIDHDEAYPQFTRGRIRLAEIIPNMIKETYRKHRRR